MQKGVFLFTGPLFFLLFVFVLFCLEKKKPKRLFPAILEFFLFPPKSLSLKVFSSYSVFSLFLLSSLSKLHHFSLFFVHQPLLGKIILGGFFCCLLPFPFIMFACFTETIFPYIPFLKRELLSLLVVSVFVLLFVFVFMVYVFAFLFLCWFCFWYVFLCFCLLADNEKNQFSLQCWCFWSCWLKGRLFSQFHVFVVVCFLVFKIETL